MLYHQHEHIFKKHKVNSQMLQRLQPRDSHRSSHVDRHFDRERAEISDMQEQNWLCNWWKVEKKGFLRIAAAGRDFLVING